MAKPTSPPPFHEFRVSLGAGAIVIHRDSVLLVQMNYGKFKGQWTQPGGKVEKGEHPSVAAQRETLEETGVEASIAGIIGVRHRNFDSGQSDVFFLFRGELENKTGESPACKWDSREILEAKFWKISDALHSSQVRPFTRIAIKLAMESELAELESIALPEGYEHDDEIFGARA